jgi:uncharacterized protein (TIGR03437 family)
LGALQQIYGSPSIGFDGKGNLYVARTQVYVEYIAHCCEVPHFTAYLDKLAADDHHLLWTRVLTEVISPALAVDAQGNAYVGAGGSVTKFDPNGVILWNIPISASPSALAVDDHGFVYATGTAGASFQTTPGSYKPTIGEAKCADYQGKSIPCTDAFVTKVRPDGSGLVYATLLGGTGNDAGTSIKADSSGNAYVVGGTASADFPVTPDAFESAYQGGGDAFFVKLDPLGKNLVYATILGGSGQDTAADITFDQLGGVVIVGSTASTDFPTTPGAYQSTFTTGGGFADISFVARFNSENAATLSSYLVAPGAGHVAASLDGRLFVSLSRFHVSAAMEGWRVTTCAANGLVVQVDEATGSPLAYQPVNGVDFALALAIDPQGMVAVAAGAILAYPFAGAPPSSNAVYISIYDFTQPDKPAVACIANAAYYRYDSDHIVSPGEIVTIRGTRLGPTETVFGEPDQAGDLPRELAGTRVSVGNLQLILLSVQERQITAMVPYDTPLGATAIQIERPDGVIGPVPWWVASATPALFTDSGSGTGPVAAINEDGTLNSGSNPARRGSVVTLFATGFGTLTSTTPDITPLAGPWPPLAETHTLYIAGDAPNNAAGMEIVYAGPAPGQPSGLIQINARVPPNAHAGTPGIRFVFSPSGSSDILTWYSPDGVTIAVQ